MSNRSAMTSPRFFAGSNQVPVGVARRAGKRHSGVSTGTYEGPPGVPLTEEVVDEQARSCVRALWGARR
jgi:hypothetical protein